MAAAGSSRPDTAAAHTPRVLCCQEPAASCASLPFLISSLCSLAQACCCLLTTPAHQRQVALYFIISLPPAVLTSTPALLVLRRARAARCWHCHPSSLWKRLILAPRRCPRRIRRRSPFRCTAAPPLVPRARLDLFCLCYCSCCVYQQPLRTAAWCPSFCCACMCPTSF